ncbi:MAG: DUF3536 domain-containing protein [Saprospiraceae bacterium]
MTSKRFICIHGHFYQPPRENAWLETVEIQASAFPYHDWNERITKECYGANAKSRILDEEGWIEKIVNNYSKISYNFGPTLLSWLEANQPKVYAEILEADRLSMINYQGHGSAIAQAYNHMIMPLADRKDKLTQIRWGLRDFESRYKRKAKGMWLGETAVDLETLSLMAAEGIEFTILAPSQAQRYRKSGSEQWIDGIDSRLSYRCHLPEGQSIHIFFYHADDSHAIAFGGLLNDGRNFARELINSFSIHEHGPELVHIATDGESYGHHHKGGDMALAMCLQQLSMNAQVQLTNYSLYLTLVPVDNEVEIRENSSWSCAHGVERWRGDCGCKTGGESGWTQQWRVGLRQAMDYLHKELDAIYIREMSPFTADIWQLRDQYISLILDRSEVNQELFFNTWLPDLKGDDNKSKILRLLEMQRHSMLMFTSCAWFFNDPSGIETIQVMQYANRALDLAGHLKEHDLENNFLAILANAYSNINEEGSIRDIYQKYVIPSRLSLVQVGMHDAIHSLFEDQDNTQHFQQYYCKQEELSKYQSEDHILAVGRTEVHAKITGERKEFSYAVLYSGANSFIAKTNEWMAKSQLSEIKQMLKASFKEGNYGEVRSIIDSKFDGPIFDFHELLKDEQIKLLGQIIGQKEAMAIASNREIYRDSAELLELMKFEKLQIPAILARTIGTILSERLQNVLAPDVNRLNTDNINEIILEIDRWHPDLDLSRFNFNISQKLEALIDSYKHSDNQLEVIQSISFLLAIIPKYFPSAEINQVQDFVFEQINEGQANEELLQALRGVSAAVKVRI